MDLHACERELEKLKLLVDRLEAAITDRKEHATFLDARVSNIESLGKQIRAVVITIMLATSALMLGFPEMIKLFFLR